jgi:fructokinase
VTVDLEPGGKPVYTIHEGVAWDAIPTTRELVALAGRARAVCFGTLAQRAEPSRRAIRAFLEATPAEALRVFDINLRQSFWSRETVEPSLELANAVKLNDEELPRVASLLAIEGSGTDLLTRLSERFGLRLVALTCGDQGSVLFAEGRVSRRPAAPAGEVADTIGAGDSFTATLVAGWLRGLELDRIHAWAGRVAGFVCTRSGATPELPAALREPPDGAAGS